MVAEQPPLPCATVGLPGCDRLCNIILSRLDLVDNTSLANGRLIVTRNLRHQMLATVLCVDGLPATRGLPVANPAGGWLA